MEKIKLQKYFTDCGVMSRRAAEKEISEGRVTVNGVTATLGDRISPGTDVVEYKGKILKPQVSERICVMLNKPTGYVSARTDDLSPTVIELLPPELQRIGLFPCGRLDKNTLGLMLLTNNGPLSHKLLAPKNHVDKKYRFETKFPISEADVAELQSGVDIGGYFTAPCTVEMTGNKSGYITLTEGKYHQIKLMAEAVHNQITYLERVSFGPLLLDTALERGEWRHLSAEEESALEARGVSVAIAEKEN